MSTPNLLLICVDHWPGRLLGCAGHEAILTPTLDQLASCGVRFSHAYSAHPICIPARRTLMTGTTARTHGDRNFNETLAMPPLPTLAQCFVDAGYQAFAVGKLHVFPQRDRIGFHEVILNEEGRHHAGLTADDYELFLAERGYAGQEYTHAMATNDYMARAWHLPEELHATQWSVREMSRIIHRRDPTRPAMWYLSFNYPHPPLVPPAAYLDMYAESDIPEPPVGQWARQTQDLPGLLRARVRGYSHLTDRAGRLARRAFYAQCTYIDHQLRLIIGLLREQKLLDNTAIVFNSDHGDMLGGHGLWAKSLFYEDSCRVPLIVVPPKGDARIEPGSVDDRLAELRDVMPTLLDLAGIPIPESVEGQSLLGTHRRALLYGEQWDNEQATRMVRDEQYKLIYYPAGNRLQLFDLRADPEELRDLSQSETHRDVRERLVGELIGNFYGGDERWTEGGRLVGMPETSPAAPDRGLKNQRGWRFM